MQINIAELTHIKGGRSFVTISDELRAHLRREQERTGIGPMRLLRNAHEKPARLNSSTVSGWLGGVTRTASAAQFDYVLKRWAILPDNRRIPFTPDMRTHLEAEFRRTGTGSVTVLAKAADCPEGLTPALIQTLLRKNINTILESHWAFLQDRLRGIPDGSSASKSVAEKYRAGAAISEDDLTELRRLREATGVGGAVLLNGANDKPAGLTAAIINGWVTGAIRTARPDFVSYVLARYRAWSRSPTISADDIAEIRDHIRRTGTAPALVLRKAPDVPHGLTSGLVSRWIAGQSDAGSPEHIAYILGRYRAWPDSVSDTPNLETGSSERLAISAEELAELRSHRERTGIGGANLLRNALDIPTGLTASMISSWLIEATKSAAPEHLAYVLARYRAWP